MDGHAIRPQGHLLRIGVDHRSHAALPLSNSSTARARQSRQHSQRTSGINSLRDVPSWYSETCRYACLKSSAPTITPDGSFPIRHCPCTLERVKSKVSVSSGTARYTPWESSMPWTCRRTDTVISSFTAEESAKLALRAICGAPEYTIVFASEFHQFEAALVRNRRAVLKPSLCTPAGRASKNPLTMASGCASFTGPDGFVNILRVSCSVGFMTCTAPLFGSPNTFEHPLNTGNRQPNSSATSIVTSARATRYVLTASAPSRHWAHRSDSRKIHCRRYRILRQYRIRYSRH